MDNNKTTKTTTTTDADAQLERAIADVALAHFDADSGALEEGAVLNRTAPVGYETGLCDVETDIYEAGFDAQEKGTLDDTTLAYIRADVCVAYAALCSAVKVTS